jgi:hypothetical protein
LGSEKTCLKSSRASLDSELQVQALQQVIRDKSEMKEMTFQKVASWELRADGASRSLPTISNSAPMSTITPTDPAPTTTPQSGAVRFLVNVRCSQSQKEVHGFKKLPFPSVLAATRFLFWTWTVRNPIEIPAESSAFAAVAHILLVGRHWITTAYVWWFHKNKTIYFSCSYISWSIVRSFWNLVIQFLRLDNPQNWTMHDWGVN